MPSLNANRWSIDSDYTSLVLSMLGEDSSPSEVSDLAKEKLIKSYTSGGVEVPDYLQSLGQEKETEE